MDSPSAHKVRLPFVGREAELHELRAGLGSAASTENQIFLLTGEPGIGKTRLAEELSGHARAAKVRVFWARCWEEGGAPAYWPWIQLLRAYVLESVIYLVHREAPGRGQAMDSKGLRSPELPLHAEIAVL